MTDQRLTASSHQVTVSRLSENSRAEMTDEEVVGYCNCLSAKRSDAPKNLSGLQGVRQGILGR